MKPGHRHLRVTILISILALLGAGCVSTSTPIEGRDKDVLFPTLRLTFEVFPGVGTDSVDGDAEAGGDGESRRPKPVDGTLAFDIETSGGWGESTQSLIAGERIVFDGTTLNGPVDVEADYDLIASSFVVRGGFLFREALNIELFGGLGITSLDLTLKSGTTELNDYKTAYGPLVGARVAMKPANWFDLYGRVSATTDFERSLSTAEAGFAAWPIENVSLFAGWRWWTYEAEVSGSDIDLELSGPFAGLNFRF